MVGPPSRRSSRLPFVRPFSPICSRNSPFGPELEDDAAVGAGAAADDPDVVLVVDEHAVLGGERILHPVVARAGAAPGLEDVAFPVELDDRRRQLLALHGEQRLDAVAVGMGDPGVVVRVDRHAPDVAEGPVVGQRPRPRRVVSERRRRGRRGFRFVHRRGRLLRGAARGGQQRQHARERRQQVHAITFRAHGTSAAVRRRLAGRASPRGSAHRPTNPTGVPAVPRRGLPARLPRGGRCAAARPVEAR